MTGPNQQPAAPSVSLLKSFAEKGQALREEAARYKSGAEEEHTAAGKIQADIEQFEQQVRTMLAEVERVRAAMDAAQKQADEHRRRGDHYQEQANERLHDAEWLDVVNARAGQLPEFAPQGGQS